MLKTRKAFSFAELLIAVVIIAIAGSAAVAALWFAINSNSLMSDYTFADAEMENAAQTITRDLWDAGLGMPNNRLQRGSFALSFQDADESRWPIMAYFGKISGDWGGPVTVTGSTSAYPTGSGGALTEPHSRYTGNPPTVTYYGPELYYAWAVPTGVRVSIANITKPGRAANNGDNLHLVYLSGIPAADRDRVSTVRWQGRNAGVPAAISSSGSGRNTREWLTLPTLRLPLRVGAWLPSASYPTSIDVTAAPVPGTVTKMERTIMEADEVHVVQAARLFLRGRDLVKVTFGDYADSSAAGGNAEEVLARNVVGLQFAHKPADGLLTVYIAVRGNDIDPAGIGAAQPAAWPAWLPPIPVEAVKNFRVLVKTVTWRIRN